MQCVSLDADKRELQRLARDSAEYYFRDKQVEASDALIDNVRALLTETGGAQIIEICSTARFTAKAGDRVLQPICVRTNRMDHRKVNLGISARPAT